MRRLHNVLVATLLIFGIIYLSVSSDSSLLDRVQSYRSKGAPTAAHSSGIPYPSHSPLAILDDTEQARVGVDPQHTASPTEVAHDTPSFTQSDGSSSSHPEFSFQEDLDVEFPFAELDQFSHHAPLHYEPNGLKTYAYATFMATRNPSLKDPYFLAIQSVVHRVLWSPRTRTRKNYPFIVFVADFVTAEQRAVLRGTGAIVRELAPLEWHCDKPGVQKRWVDLFAKLNMWAETEFSRIIFLDADAFPLMNIDDMFELTQPQMCIEQKMVLTDLLPGLEQVCEPYIFAGVPQDPFSTTEPNINVGAMVITPSTTMHRRLLQNFNKTEHYDCAMAEQAFLNWQFGVDGAFPLMRLERTWGGFFPQPNEQGKLRVVHEKIWVEGGWLGEEWERGWNEMVEWYSSGEFAEERNRM
jgi:inositol 3-alpha-galactosyltransferase